MKIDGHNDALKVSLERHTTLRNKARYLQRVGIILLEHYRCEGFSDLLEVVTQLFNASMNLAVISDPTNIPTALGLQGDALFARYELYYDLDALEKSIAHFNGALSRSNTNSSRHLDETKVALAYALFCRFEAISCHADCEMAVKILKTAREHVDGNNSANEAWVLTITALVKTRRSVRSVMHPTLEEFEDLWTSLRKISRSVLLSRSRYVQSLLAEVYLSRALFEKTSSQEALLQGLTIADQVLLLSSEYAVVVRYNIDIALFGLHNMIYIHNRGNGLWQKHLTIALEIADRMRKATLSKWHTDSRWRSLHSWTLASLERCDQEEDLDGMEHAIKLLYQVVTLCPQSHISRPLMVSHLSATLGFYFYQSGRISALDALIDLRSLHADYLLRTPYLASNISEAMLSRAQIADVVSAKSLIKEAIHLCLNRKDEAGLGLTLNEQEAMDLQLISASRMQLRIGDDPFLDSDTILELCRQGSSDIESSHRIGIVLAQTEVLTSRARASQNISHLQEAEQILEKEMSNKDTNSSIFRVDVYAAQADLMIARSDLLGTHHAILENAWELYERAARAASGRTRERFQASLRWASNATNRGYALEAFKGYSCATDILPNLVFVGEDIIGRIEALREVNGLAASSVAAALDVGDASSAVQLLEQTRGILWLQSSHIRTPLLEFVPDALREKYKSIALELQAADRLQWTSRRQKADELGKLATEIRKLPGLGRFMLPPLLDEVISALKGRGYAVIISPSKSCTDVVVLGTVQGHSHLRLHGVDMRQVREWSTSFTSACASVRSSECSSVVSRKIASIQVKPSAHKDSSSGVLSAMWFSLVQPIIEHMDMRVASDHISRKRVWWCPIGPLGSLPLHAAGVYDGPSQDHTSNYVISSYVPTLAALHRLLVSNQGPAPRAAPGNMLLVAQPERMNQSPIPHTQVEVDLVRSLVPAGWLVNHLNGRGMTMDAALQAMSNADVIHFACHGHQDQGNPLDSGFELEDGRLTLGQLMRVSTPHAQLAYLSTCESAGMDEGRPDEGLNLASAMMFVGFRSVIGTLWAMDDIDGPFMANHIYTRIFRDGVLDMGTLPLAIDNAVMALRGLGVPASRWATYVHIGV